jgi:sirohydrochlorin ferrochelatase
VEADRTDHPPDEPRNGAGAARGSDPPSRGLPGLHELDTRRDAREALDQAVAEARAAVKIFDLDGAFWGFERRAFGEALAALLARNPASTVTLLLHDTRFVQVRCPRLMALLARRSGRLRIMPTPPSIRSFSRGVAVVDDRIALRRAHFSQSRVFVDDDPVAVARAARLFEDIEREALPSLSATTTGL